MPTELRYRPTRHIISLLALALALTALTAAAKPSASTHVSSEVIAGKIRVQLLSDSLVRLEEQGAQGFENRLTFHVVNRNWPGVSFHTNTADGRLVITTANYQVSIPPEATSLKDIRVLSANGDLLFSHNGQLENSKWLPGPAEHPAVWFFADTPRIIPP